MKVVIDSTDHGRYLYITVVAQNIELISINRFPAAFF